MGQSADRAPFGRGSFLEPVTVTFATVQEAQAAFLACERLRVNGGWPVGPQNWHRAGEHAELTLHYALKEINAHDF